MTELTAHKHIASYDLSTRGIFAQTHIQTHTTCMHTYASFVSLYMPNGLACCVRERRKTASMRELVGEAELVVYTTYIHT